MDVRDTLIGDYDLFVGGVKRGTVAVQLLNSKTRGTIVFKTADSGSGDSLLDFPVSQQPVELRQGSTVFFAGTAPELPTSTDTGGVGVGAISLVRAPGVSAEAEANASLEFGISGPVELQVEAEKLPVGVYDVMIGEALRGTLNIAVVDNVARGSIVFSAEGSPGASLLNFPTAGQTIAISQGAVVFFTGQLPSSAPAPAP